MALRVSSVRSLRRAATVAVLTGALCTVSAPAAGAAATTAAGSPTADVVPVQGAEQGSGWLDDVRADSADSTKTVAGIAVVLVAGVTTAVTVRPRRRPPVGGRPAA